MSEPGRNLTDRQSFSPRWKGLMNHVMALSIRIVLPVGIYIYVCQNPKNHDRGMGLWRASLTRLAKSILCVIYGVSTTAYPTLTLKDLPFHGLI